MVKFDRSILSSISCERITNCRSGCWNPHSRLLTILLRRRRRLAMTGQPRFRAISNRALIIRVAFWKTHQLIQCRDKTKFKQCPHYTGRILENTSINTVSRQNKVQTKFKQCPHYTGRILENTSINTVSRQNKVQTVPSLYGSHSGKHIN